MAAKKDVKLIRELETKDQFEAALSDPTRLFIVDVYDEWYSNFCIEILLQQLINPPGTVLAPSSSPL